MSNTILLHWVEYVAGNVVGWSIFWWIFWFVISNTISCGKDGGSDENCVVTSRLEEIIPPLNAIFAPTYLQPCQKTKLEKVAAWHVILKKEDIQVLMHPSLQIRFKAQIVSVGSRECPRWTKKFLKYFSKEYPPLDKSITMMCSDIEMYVGESRIFNEIQIYTPLLLLLLISRYFHFHPEHPFSIYAGILTLKTNESSPKSLLFLSNPETIFPGLHPNGSFDPIFRQYGTFETVRGSSTLNLIPNSNTIPFLQIHKPSKLPFSITYMHFWYKPTQKEVHFNVSSLQETPEECPQ